MSLLTKHKIGLLLLLLCCTRAFPQHTYHVAKNGSDRNHGTRSQPLLTISAAAEKAVPGDVIIVHAGTYREEVRPERGGTSDKKRIIYEAASGEHVEITGSEVIKGWQIFKPHIWKVTVPQSEEAPYSEIIRGDWYFGSGLHTGEVYLNGKALHEVTQLNSILSSIPIDTLVGTDSATHLNASYIWYTQTENGSTVIYADFGEHDPNKEQTEINVRSTCFYPLHTGVDYITVRGFEMSRAATQWSAPTAEQIGIIGTNWSKGWIIEDNIIHDSKCVGITLGKDSASGQNGVPYNDVVLRVIAEGWGKGKIGSHAVLHNTVYDCGAAGICGSFGGAYSKIIGNDIYDIYTYRPYWGAEMGGIKLHAAIDVLIKDNIVHNTYQGIWLDWMAQGTRVTHNLCYNNDYVDFFPEVDHGPYLVDNNYLLSGFSVKDWSEGGAYVYNLIAGMVSRAPQDRETPWFLPHSTIWAGNAAIKGSDNRFYGNIFIGTNGKEKFQKSKYLPGDAIDEKSGYGLSMYEDAVLPVSASGNVYYAGAVPLKTESQPIMKSAVDILIRLNEKADRTYFDLPAVGNGKQITTAVLGGTRVSHALYEREDGKPINIEKNRLLPSKFSAGCSGISRNINVSVQAVYKNEVDNK